MSEAKFTPGPWSIEKRGPRTVILKRRHWAVGGGPGNKGVGFAFGDTDANAHLIAAAPDLLAFVMAQFASTVCICAFKASGYTDIPCTRCDAESLIAKAEGR